MITHKHSRKRSRPQKQRKPMHKVPSEPTSGLNSIYSICRPCSFPFLTCSYFLFLNPRPHPSSIPTPLVWVCHPHPPSAPSCFLAVPKLELEARHPLEMASCVVTETTWSRCSFTTPFRAIDHPSLPPTTLAASWSMKLMLSTPRRPKLSNAIVASLWLRSWNHTCPGRV